MADEAHDGVLQNLDHRLEGVEQILPTLATREEMRAAIKEAVAPLATREEMHAAIKGAVAPLATREEMHAAIKAESESTQQRFGEVYAAIREDGETTRRHMDVVAESLRDDIRIIAEGHASLQQQVSTLEGRHDCDIRALDGRVTRLEGGRRTRSR